MFAKAANLETDHLFSKLREHVNKNRPIGDVLFAIGKFREWLRLIREPWLWLIHEQLICGLTINGTVRYHLKTEENKFLISQLLSSTDVYNQW